MKKFLLALICLLPLAAKAQNINLFAPVVTQLPGACSVAATGRPPDVVYLTTGTAFTTWACLAPNVFTQVSAGLPTANLGSYLVSQGSSNPSILQTQPTFDVRSSQVGFDCTGSTAMDTAMQGISSTAHILVPTGCIVRLSSAHSYPQTIEFKQGAQFQPDTGILITLTGSIIAGSYQIFNNALATQGGIDFTGNVNTFDVLPEWWGAGSNVSAATNTTAIQAAIYGAFGCNTSPATTCRSNASGISYYNKRLYLAGKYAISGELHWYHTLNFVVQGAGRLFSGIVQTAANSRIIDGQSNAYGVFRDLSFTATSNTQDLNHPLVDLNFTGSQGADLATQFIDFYDVNWNGNQLAKIGFRVAAAGGGAQGSNIHFYNNLGENFTEAAYMVGAGSGGTATTVATNAVSIIWQNGDCQANFAYCIEAFGLSNGRVDSMTFEDGGSPSLGQTPQTGFDILASNAPAGGLFNIENARSESTFFATGSTPLIVRNSYVVDEGILIGAGSVLHVNDIIQGTGVGSHGVYYIVTVAGTASGLATPGSPLSATSGTATTIVDSVGGFTVNAWNGWQVSIQSGTAALQYCIITSNTANTFTCSAGWVTDFAGVTVVNPDNTSRYVVEPNWGTQLTSGGVTWAAIAKGQLNANATIDNVFIPGLQVSAAGNTSIHHLEVTRSDWLAGGFLDNTNILLNADGVIVGSPDNGPGTGAGNLGAPNFLRSSKFNRNTIVEVPQFYQQFLGTKTLHWASGGAGGGVGISDVYMGVQGTVALQGSLLITNNSANVQRKWNFNYDGSATAGTTGGGGVGWGIPLVSTAAISGSSCCGVPVKADTANANQVVITTTTDTGAGIVVGVCTNSFSSPGAGATCNVIQIGAYPLNLGTGTCAIGNFVIVDTTTNGRVKCTATYTAGTVIGVALAAQNTVGNAVETMIGLR